MAAPVAFQVAATYAISAYSMTGPVALCAKGANLVLADSSGNGKIARVDVADGSSLQAFTFTDVADVTAIFWDSVTGGGKFMAATSTGFVIRYPWAEVDLTNADGIDTGASTQIEAIIAITSPTRFCAGATTIITYAAPPAYDALLPAISGTPSTIALASGTTTYGNIIANGGGYLCARSTGTAGLAWVDSSFANPVNVPLYDRTGTGGVYGLALIGSDIWATDATKLYKLATTTVRAAAQSKLSLGLGLGI